MTFVGDATPSQYKAVHMVLSRNGEGGVAVRFEMALYNSEGRRLMHKKWDTDLTSNQLDTFLGFYNNKMEEFETETGLTEL